MDDNKADNLFGTHISVYTRAQAIADRILVDVSAMANEAGFKISVAVTNTVWHNFIEWTAEDSQRQLLQDKDVRLWDILYMLYINIIKDPNTDYIFYKFYTIPRDGKTKKASLIQLKAIIGYDDTGELAITIMLPNED